MILTIVGIIFVFVGVVFTWCALRGLLRTRAKPRQRVDASVFAVMEIHAQEYRPRIAQPNIISRGRRDSLTLDTVFPEGGTPGQGLFNKPAKSSPVEEFPPSALHMRPLYNNKEGESKTLGL